MTEHSGSVSVDCARGKEVAKSIMRVTLWVTGLCISIWAFQYCDNNIMDKTLKIFLNAITYIFDCYIFDCSIL